MNAKVGRPPQYPLGQMAVGDTLELCASVERNVRRNVSQYGARNSKKFECHKTGDKLVIKRTA